MATTHIPTPTPSAHHSTRSMALNLAEWMSDSLQPFGVQTYFDDGFWWRKPGGSGIYLGALNLDTQADNTALLADLQRVKAAWGGEEFSLYDCWGTYDLSVGGFERVVQNSWYLRPAGELATGEYQLPAGLSVARVATVAELIEFERASWVGFEESEEMLDSRPPFSWHPAATVENPNMHYLVARFAGQVVAGVIVQTSADMLGIYGLSTLPTFRRRGYATALIRAAVALRPDLPACVFPDPPSVPIYTPLGFVVAGEIAIWQRKQ